jgi:hypothetical protein
MAAAALKINLFAIERAPSIYRSLRIEFANHQHNTPRRSALSGVNINPIDDKGENGAVRKFGMKEHKDAVQSKGEVL